MTIAKQTPLTDAHDLTRHHPLDNPVYAALTGPQAHLGETVGRAVRYLSDVAPFAGLPDEPTAQDWADLARLAGPESVVILSGRRVAPPPDGWDVIQRLDGVQFVASGVAPGDGAEAVPLGAEDVPEMLDLVERTRPGPFRPRTVEFGGYLGIRRGGRLVAMAGTRMRVPGWTEISALCTDDAHRGQGLAGRLVRAVATQILAGGDRPFLHSVADNAGAVRLYAALGFELRCETPFMVLRVPPEKQPAC
ncbi:FR47-like protein [Actinopolymorpha cephalotaxi]|uniref:FR47-like protein n=1 Tax=Actinopolymorpha cephalotaxi TaxID=504797 RepID=A0A1I2PKL5_9ACTN|nr:GNAT family N-acetyltransferase [Actinopolymorpha cephalotaxi]NYH83651.1 ribosomal protein S18 acetylase RimI-like enzyme [Actinopolymorpha cephalotaxi]SFG14166.1 FR47-like protein [Actinopolymorpha cephalotaxi]